jgi:hypothetical protein
MDVGRTSYYLSKTIYHKSYLSGRFRVLNNRTRKYGTSSDYDDSEEDTLYDVFTGCSRIYSMGDCKDTAIRKLTKS